jgi:hypothetical protein
MISRSSGAYVVLVFVLVVAAASQAGAAELSLAGWWNANYGSYPDFDSAWQWVDWDVWHDGKTFQQIGVEIAGYANGNSFGWYDLGYAPSNYAKDANGYHEIFGGTAGQGATATVTFDPGTLFTWYLHTPEGKTWQTNEYLESHPDAYFHHAWVFESKNDQWKNLKDTQTDDYSKAYLIAWEDLSTSSNFNPPDGRPGYNNAAWYQGNPVEPDNNDMVVFLWTKETMTGYPVPEPGSLGLLALALCGAVAAGRKRRSS